MLQKFDYLLSKVYTEDIQIKDIGQSIIEATDGMACNYILWIKTTMGITKIIEFGPYSQDGLTNCLKEFKFTYTKINYMEGKIIDIIKKFLNNPKYKILQAKEITLEEFKENYNLDLFYFMED